MQITKDNLTIVIVTIKSDEVIEKCLDSIDPEVKKIIVENSSNENFIKKLKSNYKNIDFYISGKNLGMGAGNNIGIKKSKTRYVMILNPDAVLRVDTLDQIYKGSKMLDFAILSPISDNINYPNFKINKKKDNLKKDLLEVDQVDGYSMIIDKLKFNDNYFDENIFMYLENDDLCLRTKKNGKKIYIYSNSLISHLGARAVDEKYSEELQFSRNWHWSWSRYYYKKKHFGFLNAFVFGLLVFIISIPKSIFYFVINNKLKSKLYYLRASGFINALLNKRSWFRPRLD